MKNIDVVLIAILFLVIGIVSALLYANNKKLVCYDLPEHGSPDVWGPLYWRSIHDISTRIPCSICREEGSELFSFVHDYVNAKISKPIYNEDNYTKWLNKFSEIKIERDSKNK